MSAMSALGLRPPVPPSLIHHVNRIGIGDFSEEKKSGTKSYKGDEHYEGVKPRRQITVKVDADSHEESAGEKGDARDLPVEVVLVEPEGAPPLEAKSEPLDSRIELLSAVFAPPCQARPLQRLQPLPVLPIGKEGVLVITGGTICI